MANKTVEELLRGTVVVQEVQFSIDSATASCQAAFFGAPDAVSLQFTGTFGTATALIQKSNNNTDWANTATTATAASATQLAAADLGFGWYRMTTFAGSATTSVLCRAIQRMGQRG
jgi:hypothetical protein